FQIQRYEKYLIYTNFLSAILIPKVLKINKLQRRLLRHLGTSNWTPYFRKMEPIREKVQAGKFSFLQMRVFVWWQ
ncbi:MAG: hypothetical protein K6E15_11545, partial [Prevotella sp.]|nr:hypothetical protein [Prevotella sp.]